ncbi:unknown [Acidiphilium sp. CAG:727]|nr:unknown [Acidiphilium sp. CAG:727]
MRGGVKNDLRTILFEHVADFARVADTRYQSEQIQVFMFAFEFLFYIVGVVLVNIENYKLFGVMRRYLTA